MYLSMYMYMYMYYTYKSFQLWSWFCPIFGSRSLLNCDVQVPHASLVAVDWPILVLPSAPRYRGSQEQMADDGGGFRIIPLPMFFSLNFINPNWGMFIYIYYIMYVYTFDFTSAKNSLAFGGKLPPPSIFTEDRSRCSLH